MSTEFNDNLPAGVYRTEGENEQVEQGQDSASHEAREEPNQFQNASTGEPESGPPTETQEHGPSAEDEARKYGWTPQDEWSGKPEQWIDAAEFLNRREGTRRLNKDLQARLDALEGTLEQRVEERLQGVRAMMQAGLDRREAEAKRLRERAFRGQDQEEWDLAEKELETIGKEREQLREPPKPAQQQFDPEVQSFLTRNASWWNQDNPMAQAATAYAVDLAKRLKGQGVPDSAHPAIIESDMKQIFPSLQIGGGQGHSPAQSRNEPQSRSEPQRQRGQAVEGGSGSQARRLLGGNREANFANLPEQAQAEFRAGVEAGLFQDTPEDRKFAAQAYMKSQAGNRN